MATRTRRQTTNSEHNPRVMARAIDMLESALLQAQKKTGRGAISIRVARQNGRLGSLRVIVEDEPADLAE